MTIGKYSLDEIQKALLSFAALAIAAVALFVGYDHLAFGAAVESLIVAGVGVIAVFGVKNATADAIDKAVMQLVTAVISVVQFWQTVDPSVNVKIGSLAFALASAYVVWRRGNKLP